MQGIGEALNWLIGLELEGKHINAFQMSARAVKGSERVLVRDGEMQSDAMRKAHVTEHDLRESLRVNGKRPDVGRVRSRTWSATVTSASSPSPNERRTCL